MNNLGVSLLTLLAVLTCVLYTTSAATADLAEGSGEAGNIPREAGTTWPQPPRHVVGWTAEEVPDPRVCPTCCGLEKPGFLCDPDRVFKDPSIGGSNFASHVVNAELWNVANHSVCPCEPESCAEWGSGVFVVVVSKLKPQENKSANVLISEFAKSYLKKIWRNSQSLCHAEVVVALSADDAVITTEVGDDITKSRMMKYVDVELVGGIVHGQQQSSSFLNVIQMLIMTYGMFLDHPPDATVHPFGGNFNTTEAASEESPKGGGLSATWIGLIIAGVVIFVVAIGISVVMPFACRRSCRKRGK